MTSISTYGQHMRMQTQNLLIQERQTNLSVQVATGKITQVYGGLGVDARTSIDLRSHVKELETYQKNIDMAELRVTSMVEAMTRIKDVARDLQTQLTKLSGQANPNMKVLNDLAKTGFEEVVNMLNTKVDGRYLFAGSDTDNAPVTDPDQYLTDIAAQVANYPTTGAAAVQGATRTIAEANTYYSTALGSPETSPVRARVDRDLDIDYTVLAHGTDAPAAAPADLPAFREIMRELATAASLTYDSKNPASFQEFTKMVEGARDGLKTAAIDVESQIGILGNKKSRMDALDEHHEDTMVLLKTRLGDVEDVDMADSIARLQASETQLEMSYRVTAMLRNVNLASYL
jgi:flagellar hook-associated protein 3 FlgL